MEMKAARVTMMMGLLLIFCILATPAISGRAEAEYRRIDVTASQDEAYMLRDNALWQLNDVYRPVQRLCSYDVDVRNIFARDGEMYAAYRADGAVHFARQGANGALDELFAVKGEEDVLDFIVAGDRIIGMWSISSQNMSLPDGMYRLFAYSLDGEEESIGWEFASAIAASGEDGVMLAYNNDDIYEIYEIDLAGGGQAQVPLEEHGGVFALARTEEAIYFINNAGLNRLSPEGTPETVYMEDFWIVPGLAVTGDSVICFAMDVRDEEPVQFVYQEPAQSDAAEKRALTVVLNGSTGLKNDRMRRAIALLRQAYPDVSVEFPQPSAEQLNTILLAGGEGADVVLVTAGYDQGLIDSGAFLDLNAFPELKEAAQPVEYLLPVTTSDSGALYGIPTLPWSSRILVSESLASRAVPGFDGKDCTWKELLTAALQFEGDLNGDQQPEVYFFSDTDTGCPEWVRQYLAANGQNLRFDTPLFRELAELYRTALNQGKISDTFSSEWGTALYTSTDVDGVNPYMETLPMPALDAGTPARYAIVDALAVNAHGDNQDIAVRFLQCYLDPHAAFDNGGLDHMRLDEGQYVDMDQFTKQEQRRIDEGREALSEAISSRHSSQFIIICENWMPQYYAGEITLDELISNLQREWDMRRLG